MVSYIHLIAHLKNVLSTAFYLWLTPSITFLVVYLCVGHIFALLDTLQPEWYKKKAVSTRCLRLNKHLWKRIIHKNVINLVIAGLVTFCLWCLRIEYWGMVKNKLTVYEVIRHSVFNYIFAEAWFFCSHYMVHKIPWLYLKIHTTHHLFKIPMALSGLFCSVSEMLLVNIPIAIFYPLIQGTPPWLLAIWWGILGVHLCISHSAHRVLPWWIEDPQYHTEHHFYADRHFGTSNTDWLENFS